MANINQVIVNGETILDLRSDTVTPETLQKGYTAHDKSGAKITGTLEASSSGGSKTVNFSGADADAVANITYISNGTTKRITIGGMESNSAEILADVNANICVDTSKTFAAFYPTVSGATLVPGTIEERDGKFVRVYAMYKVD